MDSGIPAYSDSLEWTTAYLTAHSLSIPSWRYSFLLWLAVGFISLAYAILHCASIRTGFLGAIWSKWSLRRRTWKYTLALAQNTNQPHRQPVSLPSNAQLLSVAILILVSLVLAFVGPDYLAPSLKVWQIQARSLSPSYQLYDTSTFTQYMPQYTVSKSLWSSSARVGQIAFALFPLCVLFALKAPPFAVFAIPFLVELYFDKLAWLHRSAGRLIWFLTFIHVVLWSIQLAKDVNPTTGRVAYIYAWSYAPFIYGWISFALLTLIILLSLKPIRRRFYEHFYILHVAIVPCMLVMAGLHHPTVAGWCWAALLLWFGERLWRGIWWIYANGIFGGIALQPTYASLSVENPSWDTRNMDAVHCHNNNSAFLYPPTDAQALGPDNIYPLHHRNHSSAGHSTLISNTQVPASPSHLAEQKLFSTSFPHSPSFYFPPSGYVHAELLSGRMMRLRLITPGFLPWSPGQHFLLNIPSISRFTSHPLTCASLCDEEAPTDAGRVMVFLVRTKDGWTRDLWELVSRLTTEGSKGDIPPASTSDALPEHGVLLRAHVDGPFGSAKRTRWLGYSTAVIVTGGSGVSFGLTLLQYMCMCLAGRDGRYLGGRSAGWRSKDTPLQRIRFIWLVREYSHVQWCASTIRRCISIAPSAALQVDIYVTNFKPIPLRHPPTLIPKRAHFNRISTEPKDELEPPQPNFLRESSSHSCTGSTDLMGSHENSDSDVDCSYYLGEFDNEPPADEIHTTHETNILDLTNFGGEVDIALPEEAFLSHRVKKEGKFRRMQSHSLSAKNRMNQATPSSRPLSHDEVPTPTDDQDSYQVCLSQHKPRLQPSRAQLPKDKTASTQLADGLLTISSLSERPSSFLSEIDFYSTPLSRPESPTNRYSTMNLISSDGRPTSPLADSASDRCDIKPEPGKSQAGQEIHSGPVPTLSLGITGSQLSFELGEHEAADINAVSEHARPGKPKLDKLIADEVQASKGPIVVACCGPTSLNAIMRKIVAAQIDPGRVRRGDMRGSITLVSEDFDY